MQPQPLPAHAASQQPVADLQPLRHPEDIEGMSQDDAGQMGGTLTQDVSYDRHYSPVRASETSVHSAHDALTEQGRARPEECGSGRFRRDGGGLCSEQK